MDWMERERVSSEEAVGWTCVHPAWIGAVLLGTTDTSACGRDSVVGPAVAVVGKALTVSSMVDMVDMMRGRLSLRQAPFTVSEVTLCGALFDCPSP